MFTGAFGLYLYLMYSDIIAQVLAIIPGTLCMWDSLSYFFYLVHDYASMYHILQSLIYWTHYYFLYFVLVGIGMPPPSPIV